MAAKDKIHDAVRNALIKDGWTITADPLSLLYDNTTVFVDLGAERVLAAERGDEKIAVEIKTFLGRSALHDIEQAVGQYVTYLAFLSVNEPPRKLFVAISDSTYYTIFQRSAIQLIIAQVQMPLLIVDVEREEIAQWSE
ncbi:MAG: XisH family protein [Caldilineaceae bacterium]